MGIAPEMLPGTLRRRSGELRVLVADDNPDAAETLADALAALGCDSRVAHDGAEAIRIAAEYEAQSRWTSTYSPI